MVNETVLITGASSGIGFEMAKLFAADLSDVILVARNARLLTEHAEFLTQRFGVRTHVLAKDLGQPTAPQEIFDELSQAKVPVDVLVNNAGFGARGPVAQLDIVRQLEMVQVNVSALTALSRLFLPGMLARKRGGILNVGSTAGFQPGPYMTVYYATKAYVQSFSEGLHMEVKGTGVNVSCLAPGPTATGFADAASMGNSRLFRLGTMSAAAVAKAGFNGFRKGKAIIVPGLRNKASVSSVRFAPRGLVRRITKLLNQ
jgi:short-subunit dehydrogenase